MTISGKRRKFSPEEKVRILRRHLVKNVPVTDLCDEYVLHRTVFHRWQSRQQRDENGTAAFERRGDGRTREAW